MYETYTREQAQTTYEKKTWEWLSKSDLKVEAEALIKQEQAFRTNYVKCNIDIDKTKDSSICRLCGKRVEPVSHLVIEYMMLLQKEYKQGLDNIARLVHWKLCGK